MSKYNRESGLIREPTSLEVVCGKPLVQVGLMQIKEEVPLGHEVYFESYCCHLPPIY